MRRIDAGSARDGSNDAPREASLAADGSQSPFRDVVNIRYFEPIGNDSGDFVGIAADPSGAARVTYGNSIGRITPAGDFTSYPMPAEDVGAPWVGNVAAAPDGSAWFATGLGRLGHIAANGVIELVPIPVLPATMRSRLPQGPPKRGAGCRPGRRCNRSGHRRPNRLRRSESVR